LLLAAGTLVATTTTPYRLRLPATFPRPYVPKDNRPTQQGVALGQRLFFDPILSRDGTISCADCHRPEHAFSDPRPKSVGIDGQLSRRHSMPLFNLAWRRDFFWDGRVKSLREQVLHPIIDPTEMDHSFPALTDSLSADPTYRAQFAAAFGDEAPTSTTLAMALEQFLLTLVSDESPIDLVLEGKPLTPQQEHGMTLFFGEFDPSGVLRGADCFHCHGNVLYANDRFANNGLDAEFPHDSGRHEVTGKDWERGHFKVPSLRNVAVTAPYMHDGRFQTLREVVDHYDHGVKNSPTLEPDIAKHNGPLGLTETEKLALIVFLEALTDERFLQRARAMAPPPAQ
jgi:cytochrome c peroxidase